MVANNGVARKKWLLGGAVTAMLLAVTTGTALACSWQRSDVSHFTNRQRVVSREHNELEAEGRVQLNHVDGKSAVLDTEAIAFASCRNCAALAVSFQVNMISPDVTNAQIISNTDVEAYKCNNCTIVALAAQYDIITSNWRHAPDAVLDLIHQMNRELSYIRSHEHMSVDDAIARVNAVMAKFQALQLPSAWAAPQHTAAINGASSQSVQPGLHVKWATTVANTTPGGAAMNSSR